MLNSVLAIEILPDRRAQREVSDGISLGCQRLFFEVSLLPFASPRRAELSEIPLDCQSTLVDPPG